MLDKLDAKLLYLLDMDGRKPLSQLAKELKVSRDTLHYRLQRFLKEGIIKKFVAQVDVTRIGYGVFKAFYKFQNTSAKKKQEIIAWLVKNPYIYWIVDCRGRWDLNITVFAEGIREFDDIIADFVSAFGPFIAEQEINTTLDVGALQKNWGLQEQQRDLRPLYDKKQSTEQLDELDKALLKHLADNARDNVTDIARDLDTTARIVAYRIKELERKGIIVGYSISVDYEKLGKQFFKATIMFNTLSKETKMRIREYCKSRQNIIYYVFCVGSWPLEIEFAVKDNREFYEEMEVFREAFPEMKSYDTLIFPKEYKFEWVPQNL